MVFYGIIWYYNDGNGMWYNDIHNRKYGIHKIFYIMTWYQWCNDGTIYNRTLVYSRTLVKYEGEMVHMMEKYGIFWFHHFSRV